MGGVNRMQTGFFKTQFDDVAQLEKTVDVLAIRVTDLQKTCHYDEKNQCVM